MADSHIQVNDFYFGNFLDFYSSIEKVDQLCVIASVTDATIDLHYVTLSLQLMTMDKITADKSNVNDVESDTLQVLNDFYQVIRYSKRWQEFSKVDKDLNAQKFEEKGGSVVNGWATTLMLKIKKNQTGVCDLPFINYSYE